MMSRSTHKTGENFLQNGPCHKVAPKLAECRECQRSKKTSKTSCRFYAFRRLCYTENGKLAVAGFSDQHMDAKADDINLWLPDRKNPPTDLDLETARFILAQLGDQFCDLLTEEAEAINIHIGENKKIAWKRVVNGVREICDVCRTTLFNFHWACGNCGFVACIDCYKDRKNETEECCTHGQNVLMPTHIIAGDALKILAGRVQDYRGRSQMPIRIMTLSESKLLYPNVPHSWLCDGKLLHLLDSMHPGNYTIFQDQWRRGQPVLVSNVTKCLDKDLWHPDSFMKDFGDVKNDLINCMTGDVVRNLPMSKFWEGFECLSCRLKDKKGNDMLLKLKDWPPFEDFAEMLPSRYNDLMKALPLGEYTQRTGRLNLVSRLPECFVRPDLGPKMYNAYGSAKFRNKGTTNLHLDVSDAVNIMVYVGIPKDANNEDELKEMYQMIVEAGCDIQTRKRVFEEEVLPGALWHIYSAHDADKIRHLLRKVAKERGVHLDRVDDPIHDQSYYLDSLLRERLQREYSVEGYAIVQCQGDAVFIPAGAPHQVCNIQNSVKIAEDFVSPENVAQCIYLTKEFRHLSNNHSNHEDKLQIKNIIYHAVKDSLSVVSTEPPVPGMNPNAPRGRAPAASTSSARPGPSSHAGSSGWSVAQATRAHARQRQGNVPEVSYQTSRMGLASDNQRLTGENNLSAHNHEFYRLGKKRGRCNRCVKILGSRGATQASTRCRGCTAKYMCLTCFNDLHTSTLK